MNQEYEKEMQMNYLKLCKYLQKKYGIPPKNFFTDESCRSKSSGITRTKDGLFIHHIGEDKYIMLATPSFALEAPFPMQWKEELCYCNFLEHLLLHCKIVEEYMLEANRDRGALVGYGGIGLILDSMGDLRDGVDTRPWALNCRNVVKDDTDYVDKFIDTIKDLKIYQVAEKLYRYVCDSKWYKK